MPNTCFVKYQVGPEVFIYVQMESDNGSPDALTDLEHRTEAMFRRVYADIHALDAEFEKEEPT